MSRNRFLNRLFELFLLVSLFTGGSPSDEELFKRLEKKAQAAFISFAASKPPAASIAEVKLLQATDIPVPHVAGSPITSLVVLAVIWQLRASSTGGLQSQTCGHQIWSSGGRAADVR